MKYYKKDDYGSKVFDYYTCDICGKELTGYGIKIVKDGTICRKGVCRKIYNKWNNILNARATFQNELKIGKIKKIDRGKGYGGIYFKY